MTVPRGQPFAFHDGLWHALESSRCDVQPPLHKMHCGLEVRVPIETTVYGEPGPDPIPWCMKCVEPFFHGKKTT
jgi:hypothetical protein